ncbi:hypothetical protein HDU67_008237 [Dinochytrium kinnereticum]|nr:hypothetical protein HDU67_008237 [Dinochytrium kinnereticum]
MGEIRSLTAKLPKANVDLLRFLMEHLDNVQQLSSENKMTITNLAVIFSPTLQINSALFKAFVLNWKALFPEGSGVAFEDFAVPPVRPRITSGVSRTTSVPPPRPPLPRSLASPSIRRSTGDKDLFLEPNPFEPSCTVQPSTSSRAVGPRKTVAAARSIDSMVAMREAQEKSISSKAFPEVTRVASPTVQRSNVNSIASQFEGNLKSVGSSPLPKPGSNGSVKIPLKGGDDDHPRQTERDTSCSPPSSIISNGTNNIAKSTPRKVPPPPPPSKRRTTTSASDPTSP